MIEITPAIIAKNFNDLKEKVDLVKPYVKWVHIDVMDGKFVPNNTWNQPEELLGSGFGVFLEAHLMIYEPEKHVDKWLGAGINRIIFHIEATSDPQGVIKICRKGKVEVGVAVNPETLLSSIEDVTGSDPVTSVDMVLIMGVTPGFGGQEFKSEVIEKIKSLRKANQHLTIGVDGGMNLETAKKAVEAGANVIVAGSYIFDSKDIVKAIEEMKGIL